MNIDELLEKYYEGTTSKEEERMLRRFFTEEEVPEHLQIHRPLFAYLAKEVKNAQEEKPVRSITVSSTGERSFRQRIYYTLGGIAAGLLLLAGISKVFPLPVTPQNYVIIDGEHYTDEKLVEAKALEALQNVSFTDDDLSNLLFQH